MFFPVILQQSYTLCVHVSTATELNKLKYLQRKDILSTQASEMGKAAHYLVK